MFNLRSTRVVRFREVSTLVLNGIAALWGKIVPGMVSKKDWNFGYMLNKKES
jgi:hypothetical protein